MASREAKEGLKVRLVAAAYGPGAFQPATEGEFNPPPVGTEGFLVGKTGPFFEVYFEGYPSRPSDAPGLFSDCWPLRRQEFEIVEEESDE